MKLEQYWYTSNLTSWLLLPLSWLFCLVVALRRLSYRFGLLYSYQMPVPVIVVGNITVGGTGKTPLVAWLVDYLIRNGFKPGVVSRGYGGKSKHWPERVTPDSDPQLVGDEAVLLARRTNCVMAVGPDRVAAVDLLINDCGCDIIVSDDGLQHYRLGRDVEIAVVDGNRRLGNGFCLPAGPLRELPSRLHQVDAVVVNGGKAERGEFSMRLTGDTLVNLTDPSWTKNLEDLRNKDVHALAGIGNPSRFFSQLRHAGLKVIEHPFPDHHQFAAADLSFDDFLPVLMTEKDAVKCEAFASERHWVLPVQAVLDEVFERRLTTLIKRK